MQRSRLQFFQWQFHVVLIKRGMNVKQIVDNLSKLKRNYSWMKNISIPIFTRPCWKYKSTRLNMMAKSTSSNMWLKRQLNDPYVKKAREQNYRCRSAFKLIEIDDKYKILKKRDVVIDCGAAPGSWTQVAVQRCSPSKEGATAVISIDLQDMVPVPGAITLPGHDFTKKETQDKVSDILKPRKAKVIISDMAPKASGIKSLDHELIIELCFSVLHFSVTCLDTGGTLLCKVWQGGELHNLEEAMRTMFERVNRVKPKASRSDSAELFLLGREFKHVPPET